MDTPKGRAASTTSNSFLGRVERGSKLCGSLSGKVE